jgi:predicted RNase H-like HicB family nuclease
MRYARIILPTKIEDMDMKFNVVLTPAEEGGYNVSVPALEGCFTQGQTEEEALENAKEAILCYLEGLEKLNEIKAQPGVSLKEVEVTL